MRKNPQAKRKTVIEQASNYMKELNLPEDKQFRFSKGWYERFKARKQKK